MKPIYNFLVVFLIALFCCPVVWGQDNKNEMKQSIDEINKIFAYEMYENIKNVNNKRDNKDESLPTLIYESTSITEIESKLRSAKALGNTTNAIFFDNNAVVKQIKLIKNNFYIGQNPYKVDTQDNTIIFFEKLKEWLQGKISTYNNNLTYPDYKFNSTNLILKIEEVQSSTLKKMKFNGVVKEEVETVAATEVTKAKLEYKIGLGNTEAEAIKNLVDKTSIQPFTFEKNKNLYIVIKNESNDYIKIKLLKSVPQLKIIDNFKGGGFKDDNEKAIISYISPKSEEEISLLLELSSDKPKLSDNVTIKLIGNEIDKPIPKTGKQLGYKIDGSELKILTITDSSENYLKYEQIEVKAGTTIKFFLDDEEIKTLKIDSTSYKIEHKGIAYNIDFLLKNEPTPTPNSNMWYWIGGLIALAFVILALIFVVPSFKKKNNNPSEVATKKGKAVNTMMDRPESQETPKTTQINEDDMAYNADVSELKALLVFVVKTNQTAQDKFYQANEEYQKYNYRVQQNEDIKDLMAKIRLHKEREEEQDAKNNFVEDTNRETENNSTSFGGFDNHFNDNSEASAEAKPKKEKKVVPVVPKPPSKVYGEKSYVSLRDIADDGKGIKEGRSKPMSNAILVVRPYTEKGREYAELSLYDTITPTFFEAMFRSLKQFDHIAILEINSTEAKLYKTLKEGKLIKRNDIWEVEEKMEARFY
jgi:hypothetical protein